MSRPEPPPGAKVHYMTAKGRPCEGGKDAYAYTWIGADRWHYVHPKVPPSLDGKRSIAGGAAKVCWHNPPPRVEPPVCDEYLEDVE